MKTTLAPVGGDAGVWERVPESGPFTWSRLVGEVAETPFESVTVTLTFVHPGAVGRQVKFAWDETQPGGRPCQAKVNGPPPPVVETFSVIGSSVSIAEGLTAGVETAGSAYTDRFEDGAMPCPSFESVAMRFPFLAMEPAPGLQGAGKRDKRAFGRLAVPWILAAAIRHEYLQSLQGLKWS